jgi:hypothetical protein
MATCLGFKQIQMPWRKKKHLYQEIEEDIYLDSRFSTVPGSLTGKPCSGHGKSD